MLLIIIQRVAAQRPHLLEERGPPGAHAAAACHSARHPQLAYGGKVCWVMRLVIHRKDMGGHSTWGNRTWRRMM